MSDVDTPDTHDWRAALPGLCTLLVGIGLARFAYTPLIPPLIDAEWFSPTEAVYLGAANLAGYLAGALAARRIAAFTSPRRALQAMMLLATAAFFACAVPISFAWYFAWRIASGLAGGVLMALAAPTILQRITPARRGFAGGIMFTGVGLGIAVSGTLVPLLLRDSLAAAWLGLGVLALLLTVASWRRWPDGRTSAHPAPASLSRHSNDGRVRLAALYAQYALIAAGLVPHMVFLVDFVSRGLGRGIDVASVYWVLFGIGAVIGPILAGRIADRFGFRKTFRFALVLQAACVGWLAWSSSAVALAVSSLVIGAAVPGVVPVVLGRVHELTQPDVAIRTRAWSIATIAFAVGQASGAYGFAFLFDVNNSHVPSFLCGAGMFVLALAIEAFVGVLARRGARPAAGG